MNGEYEDPELAPTGLPSRGWAPPGEQPAGAVGGPPHNPWAPGAPPAPGAPAPPSGWTQQPGQPGQPAGWPPSGHTVQQDPAGWQPAAPPAPTGWEQGQPAPGMWAPPVGPEGWPPAPAEPGTPGWTPQPAAGPWGPNASGQPSAPYVEPRRARRTGLRKGLVVGLLAAVVVVIGGGAAGANAYAKDKVCSALKSDSAAEAGGSTAASAASEADAMNQTADQLRGYGRMLVLSRGLHTAVVGLAGDMDEMAALTRKASTGKLSASDLSSVEAIATSVNTHAEAAQTACGLPATGIFDS